MLSNGHNPVGQTNKWIGPLIISRDVILLVQPILKHIWSK